jgi:antitoxin (DNA-binding transcriptional repressor) of toxin-antitoxin stability system
MSNQNLTPGRETNIFHDVNANAATVRELRTDFRAVRRRIEEHGEVIITDRGEPAYAIRPLPKRPPQRGPLPDYYARLRKRQPAPMSGEETRRFWEEERR